MSARQTILRQEALKERSKLIARMKLDRPKLYGLILEHISRESKDEVAQDADYETWYKVTDPEKLWQVLVKTHKVDCMSNVSQVKKLMARKAYQQIKQGPFESLAQFRERFKETYCSYKNTLMSANPINIEEKEQATVFFHALDAGRYGTFKTIMLNWAAGAFNPPDMVNKIYRTAGSWVKPVPQGEGGTVVSYVTIEKRSKAGSGKEETRKSKETEAGSSGGSCGGSSSRYQGQCRQETTTQGPIQLQVLELQ